MPHRILIIDDSAEDRGTYRRFLRRCDESEYRTIEAETLEEGLNLYRQETPDLILLDYHLPDGTALEFIEKVKDGVKCPIVILAGREDGRSAVRAMKAGASDYLFKDDLNPLLLTRTVRGTIEKYSLLQRIETKREERRLSANLALRIRDSLDLNAILTTTVAEVREFIGADRVVIYRFEPDMNGTIVAESTLPPWRECLNVQIEDTCFRECRGGEYRNGKITAVEDVASAGYTSCHLELLREFEVRANAVFPIALASAGGEPENLWGLLIVHQCSRTRRWQESEIECLRQIAVQLGIALGQAQLYESARQTEEKFRQIAETIEEIFWIASPDLDRILYISPAFEKILGYPREIFYRNPRFGLEIAHPDDRERLKSVLGNPATGDGHDIEYRVVHADGEIRWIHDRSFPVRNSDGQIERFIGIAIDITERKRLEDNLFQEKELAEITLRSIGDCVITTDERGRITYVNPVAERLLGLTNEGAKGQFLDAIARLLDETTRQPRENPVARVLRERRVTRLEEGTILVARDGKEYAVADSAAPILDRSGNLRGTVLVLNDVTATRAMTRQLRARAERDALTGLYNRFYFERELHRAIAEVKADPALEHILCYLDLDRFKIVNDTCGHAAGDELLRQLSSVLGNRIRATDTLARIGGDEFALLLYRCPLDKGRDLAETIVRAVREFQFARDDKIFRVGVSIGLVALNDRVENPEKILGIADGACYAAKEAGRNRVHIYHDRDEHFSQTARERQWVLEVRSAIEENRLCLYRQAISPVNPSLLAVPLSEILLRLRATDGSIVSPMAFLPAMERYGLMPEIDRAVIDLLFRHLEENDDPGSERYMINLSGASVVDERFLDFLVGKMKEHRIRPGSIGFEITETVAVSNFVTAREFIGRLSDLGCSFALDDFGSGMSSFGYLKNLPVDYLKIDGHFVRDILDDPLDAEIVSAIGRIASRLGIRTIAEFVENEAVRSHLLDIGIDYVQGYGIAPVLPLASADGKTLQ